MKLLALGVVGAALACRGGGSQTAGDGGGDAGSDDGGTVTWADVCASIVHDECSSALEQCAPQQWDWPSQAACEQAWSLTCNAEITSLPPGYLGATTAADLKACYDSLGAASIGQLSSGCVLAPDASRSAVITAVQSALKTCSVLGQRGSVALGGSCLTSASCASGLRCQLADAGIEVDGSIPCGACVAAAQKGQPCRQDYDCDDTAQLYCDNGTRTCQPATAGAPCTGATCGGAAAGLFPPLYCDPQLGVCKPWLEQGQSCAGGGRCDPLQLLDCTTTDQTCQPVSLSAGAACSGNCGPGLYCATDGTCHPSEGPGAGCTAGVAKMCDTTQGLTCSGSTCSFAYAKLGQSCTSSGQCWQAWCGPTTDAGVATCNEYGIVASPCMQNAGCAPPLTCVNGACGAVSFPALACN
jgi:hypothetical protein